MMRLTGVALFVAALATHSLVAAVGCTQAQKEQMLDAITSNPNWSACQQATAPFDFFLALTQKGPSPTSTDMAKFLDSSACNTVYSSFQEAIKQANCDEVAGLVGVPVDVLVPAATATITPTTPQPPAALATLAPPVGSIPPPIAPKPTNPSIPAPTQKPMEARSGKVRSSSAAAYSQFATSAVMAAVVAVHWL